MFIIYSGQYLPENMEVLEAVLQIRVHGRGGQGAQRAAQILAMTFFREGKYVQGFATYGGAIRGTGVSSFIRIDDRPIRLRCNIVHPDAILCLDASLLEEDVLQGATEKTIVLLNSTQPPEAYKKYGNLNIYTIDGRAIASRNGLGRIVNSTLLGALAGLLDAPDFENLQNVIEETSPVKIKENLNSSLDGYNLIRAARGVA